MSLRGQTHVLHDQTLLRRPAGQSVEAPFKFCCFGRKGIRDQPPGVPESALPRGNELNPEQCPVQTIQVVNLVPSDVT